MRKTLLFLFALVCAFTTQAQNLTQQEDSLETSKSVYDYSMMKPLQPTYKNGVLVSSAWSNNWFINISGGGSAFLGNPLGCEDLFGRIKPSLHLSIGKWFTPYIGARVSYEGFQFKDAYLETKDYQQFHTDLLWNVLGNAYNARDRPRWKLVPYAGVGVIHNKDNGNHPFALSYGVLGQYAFSQRTHLTMELGGKTCFDLDGHIDSREFGDNLLSFTVGLSFQIGKVGWKRVVDETPYIYQNEMLLNYSSQLKRENHLYKQLHEKDLKIQAELKKILELEGLLDKYILVFESEDQITDSYPVNNYSGLNSLRARLKHKHWDGDSPLIKSSKMVKSDDMTALDTTAYSIETKNDTCLQHIVDGQIVGAPIFFFFELGSSIFKDETQMLNIKELARVATKHQLHITLIGAADSVTGTTVINNTLSKARADYISAKLVACNVDESTISKVFVGGITDYSPNEANRHTKVVLSIK